MGTRRRGPVFAPQPINTVAGPGRKVARVSADRAGHIISAIGKAARIKVNTDLKTGDVKYASAHDLRRSFGERWAMRVMPQVLMQLMRHASITTTMRYYVGRNAQLTAEVLYDALEKSNILGNSHQKSSPATQGTNLESH